MLQMSFPLGKVAGNVRPGNDAGSSKILRIPLSNSTTTVARALAVEHDTPVIDKRYFYYCFTVNHFTLKSSSTLRFHGARGGASSFHHTERKRKR